MKKLVLGALIAVVVSQAAGCIISSDDTGNSAFITANWSIKSVAGSVASCPPGFDTTALYSQPIDSLGNNAGAVVIDLFNCDNNSGVSAPLFPGLYASHIAIATHDNSSQYATSTEAEVDVTNVDKSFNAAILTDGGYFQATWNLTKASNGAPLLCADVVGISGVELVTTVSSGTAGVSDIFPCEDHFGITGGFGVGNYTISVDALNGQNQAIGTAPTITNKTIQAPNKVSDLGTVTVPITAL